MESVVSKAEQERAMFIGSALFQLRTSAPGATIALAVADAAESAGRNGQDIERDVKQTLQVISDERLRWKRFGFDIALDPYEQERRLVEAVQRSGVLNTSQIERTLRERYRALLTSEPNASGKIELRIDVLQANELDLLGKAYDRYRSGKVSFRAVYDVSLASVLGAKPGDSVDSILSSNPKFAEGPAVKAVLTAIKGSIRADGSVTLDDDVSRALKKAVSDSAREGLGVVRDGAKLFTSPSEARSLIEDKLFGTLSRSTGIDTRRVAAAAMSLKSGITLSNSESAIFVVESVLSRSDPEGAKKFAQIARAAVQIAQVCAAFYSGAGVGMVFAGMGAGSMTGGMFNAVGGLSSLSGGKEGGSDPETKTMLQAIGEQIETLRQEMHARFDVVDAKLNDIQHALNLEFSKVQDHLNGISTDLTSVKRNLINSRDQLAEVESNLLDAIGDLHREMRQDQLEVCASWLDHTRTVRLSDADYVKCMIMLHGWAVRRSAFAVDAGKAVNLDSASVDRELQRNPFKNLVFWFAAVDQIGARVIQPGDFIPPREGSKEVPKLVAPIAWMTAVNAYERMASAFPDQYVNISLIDIEDIGETGRNTLERIERFRSENPGRRAVARLLDYLEKSRLEFSEALAASQTKILGDTAEWSELKTGAPAAALPTCEFFEYWDSPKRRITAEQRDIHDALVELGLKFLQKTNRAKELKPAVASMELFSVLDQGSALDISLPSGLALGVPPQLRAAESLGLGRTQVCLAKAYQTGKGGLVTLTLGVLFKFKNGPWVWVGQYEVTGRESYKTPIEVRCGGVVGCINEREAVAGWRAIIEDSWRDSIRRSWEEGSVFPAQVDIDALADIGRAAAAASAEIRKMLSDQIYRVLLDPLDDSKAKVLKRRSIAVSLAKGLSALVFEAEVNANDAFHALTLGSSPLIGTTELQLLKQAKVDVWQTGIDINRRDSAFGDLLMTAFEAATGHPSPDLIVRYGTGQITIESELDTVRGAMRRTLEVLSQMYREQAQLCKSGRRPPAECKVEGRFP